MKGLRIFNKRILRVGLAFCLLMISAFTDTSPEHVSEINTLNSISMEVRDMHFLRLLQEQKEEAHVLRPNESYQLVIDAIAKVEVRNNEENQVFSLTLNNFDVLQFSNDENNTYELLNQNKQCIGTWWLTNKVDQFFIEGELFRELRKDEHIQFIFPEMVRLTNPKPVNTKISLGVADYLKTYNIELPETQPSQRAGLHQSSKYPSLFVTSKIEVNGIKASVAKPGDEVEFFIIATYEGNTKVPIYFRDELNMLQNESGLAVLDDPFATAQPMANISVLVNGVEANTQTWLGNLRDGYVYMEMIKKTVVAISYKIKVKDVSDIPMDSSLMQEGNFLLESKVSVEDIHFTQNLEIKLPRLTPWFTIDDENENDFGDPGEILHIRMGMYNQEATVLEQMVIKSEMETLSLFLVEPESVKVHVYIDSFLQPRNYTLFDLLNGTIKETLQPNQDLEILVVCKLKSMEEFQNQGLETFAITKNKAYIGNVQMENQFTIGRLYYLEASAKKLCLSTCQSPTVSPGDKIEFTMTLTNHGNQSSNNHQLRMNFLNNIEFFDLVKSEQEQPMIMLPFNEDENTKAQALSNLFSSDTAIQVDIPPVTQMDVSFSLYLKPYASIGAYDLDKLAQDLKSELVTSFLLDEQVAFIKQVSIPAGKPLVDVQLQRLDTAEDTVFPGQRVSMQTVITGFDEIAKQTPLQLDVSDFASYVKDIENVPVMITYYDADGNYREVQTSLLNLQAGEDDLVYLQANQQATLTFSLEFLATFAPDVALTMQIEANGIRAQKTLRTTSSIPETGWDRGQSDLLWWFVLPMFVWCSFLLMRGYKKRRYK